MRNIDLSDYTNKEVKQHFKDTYYENQICSEVGQELERCYPGWRWWVECRLPSGMFSVRNLDLHGDHGFAVPIAKYLTNPERHRLVMRLGGETLERYNQERRKRPEQVEVDRDIKGNAIGDTD